MAFTTCIVLLSQQQQQQHLVGTMKTAVALMFWVNELVPLGCHQLHLLHDAYLNAQHAATLCHAPPGFPAHLVPTERQV